MSPARIWGWFLQANGLVFAFAFAALALQGPALFGSHGLTPVTLFQEQLIAARGGFWKAFDVVPGIFWQDASDTTLLVCAWLGTALSLLAAFGFQHILQWLCIWVLYLSFAGMGQVWLGFGWDILLPEAALFAVFVAPVRSFKVRDEPEGLSSLTVLRWLCSWLMFRLMVGAGLIKWRGDSCWHDLSCLFYHFETQPGPSPLSWYFHQLPQAINQLGVLFNHFVELIVPFFLFLPPFRNLAVFFIVLFQLTLIASGNLAFFNHLTIALALGCLEPGRWPFKAAHRADIPMDGWWLLRRAWVFGYALLVLVNSPEPLLNLFSEKQAMNKAWGPYRVVNSYGAFGSINQERLEVVVEGTLDSSLDTASWQEYDFPCKPGDIERRPCFLAPYHLRLDWQLWFAGMSPLGRQPWLVHLVWKLLHNDPTVLTLVAHNPFPDKAPTWIRILRYRYHFGAETWWEREQLEVVLKPVSLESEDLVEFVQARGWY
jgi:hypothetical protein